MSCEILLAWKDTHYFVSCCRLTFETALKLRGGPSVVFAHSMGNNVFRYFLEWLKLEIAPKGYNQWLDEHIHAYFAVGTLALPEAVICFLVFLRVHGLSRGGDVLDFRGSISWFYSDS